VEALEGLIESYVRADIFNTNKARRLLASRRLLPIPQAWIRTISNGRLEGWD
jgi:hypothetical protein